ncbi:hypothetical protein JYK22_14395, partial [Nonomuraea sp. RK-328]|nr:hypothetical protein [Nonomuraea sp. RK-328]
MHRWIRTLAIGGLLASAMTVVPAAAMPAQASASTAHSFTFWSPHREGSFKGVVYEVDDRFYVRGTLWDGAPGPQDYTQVRFRYFDEFGESHLETHKVVSGTKHFGPFRITRDFDLRMADVGKLGTVWGDAHDVF